ncbi:hypothetical protein BO99DRAFT_407498 [Aspergillus violaceofuscus CBS 115571]|uniref:Uncharacterized protein n=1 Tax=Aspergillus violaceofuscus (strain CBS 115571) TaxID=1450538 RepID=A0A2V5HC15_ASPV1|nr:hypothetical protein BO99DRAFT_407498 [Aspergillus violaceofuscus CBS 115571]
MHELISLDYPTRSLSSSKNRSRCLVIVSGALAWPFICCCQGSATFVPGGLNVWAYEGMRT